MGENKHRAENLADALQVSDPETTYQLNLAAGDGPESRHAR